MKIKALIVDDEALARKSLERLSEKSDQIEIAGICASAEEALQLLEKHKVDLIFLDIEMPGLSGLELIDHLPYLPHIVITTGNKEYAYDAFEYDVTDFLIKPIAQPRFLASIEKVIARENRISAIAGGSSEKELYVKTDGKYIRLPYDKIMYFENVGDYIKIITDGIGTHVIYGALKAIDEKLTYPRFLKVHRSFIVNLDKIKDIEDNTLVIDKKVIPISRAYKPIIMKTINIL